VSNILPKETQRLCDAYFAHDTETARKLQLGLMDIINALFSDVNPIPVKAALNMQGFDVGSPRLPLTELTDAHKFSLRNAMIDFGCLDVSEPLVFI
jgi:4-hydroxy-tetrahydrodipicolinate synthase